MPGLQPEVHASLPLGNGEPGLPDQFPPLRPPAKDPNGASHAGDGVGMPPAFPFQSGARPPNYLRIHPDLPLCHDHGRPLVANEELAQINHEHPPLAEGSSSANAILPKVLP